MDRDVNFGHGLCLTDPHPNYFLPFTVACTRLYKPLCRSVRPLVADYEDYATYGDRPYWLFMTNNGTQLYQINAEINAKLPAR